VNKIQQYTSGLLHLFFPHLCAGCGSDIVTTEQQLCLRCIMALPQTNFFNIPGNPVEAAFYGRVAIKNAAAGYYFTKQSLVQHIVFQLKYKGNTLLGFYMGQLLGQHLLKSSYYNQVDVMVPLPLNPAREKKRGYNQATLLCNGIASVWKKPVLDKTVIRKVYTETQTKMGRINRWQNMEGVFKVTDAPALMGKHVLLVDDVVTTGASLEACGAEILKIPGTTVSLATFAYTLP